MRRISVVIVLLVTSSTFAESGAQRQPPPHIIFLLADDLGWKDVGFHGGKIKTPNLDQLAASGVRLNQFYVQPVCSPTRASLMTGRYPLRYGLQCGVVRPWAQHGLPLTERLLPQVLRDAGYKTEIVGKWHLGHVSRKYLPTQRGFTFQYGHYNGALDYFTHIRDGGHDWHQNDKPNYDKGYATNLIADVACKRIAAHDGSQPLFLYVPFNAPHTPLQAPQKYIKRYAHMKNRRRRVFAAMVSCLDDAIGRIRQTLQNHRKKFPKERTLIFFCSDNGGIPRLGSNGRLRSGKGSLYEGGVRVPAVAVWDGVLQPGKVVKAPLHIVDMFPTIARLATGKPVQFSGLDGRDAWPTIKDNKPSPHQRIIHNVSPFHASIRVGDWKLIHNGHVRANAVRKPRREKFELFNIKDDPREQNNLHTKRPAVAARLTKQLVELRRVSVKPKIAPNRPPLGFQVPKIWGQN